jgi:3-methyladenine DNA glycosylase/8-oxoguanine DNA glycosylase
MNVHVPAHPPFSLSAVVRSHGWWQLSPFDWDDAGGVLTRVERLSTGRVVELRLRESDVGVSIDVGDRLSEAESQEAAAKAVWMLQLDLDLGAFYALARAEPRLAHVEEQARGRILRSASLFEDVVKTILTTNVQWSGTIRMVEKLVSAFGDPLPAHPARQAFPAPERLAETNEKALRAAGLGYRAPYVLELARSVSSGEFDLEGLKDAGLPTTELRKQLLAIKGVGDYAAANLLILLGHHDFLPIDSWAMTMVSWEWYNGDPVGRAEVEAAFEHWGEWKGLAYWFWDWTGER